MNRREMIVGVAAASAVALVPAVAQALEPAQSIDISGVLFRFTEGEGPDYRVAYLKGKSVRILSEAMYAQKAYNPNVYLPCEGGGQVGITQDQMRRILKFAETAEENLTKSGKTLDYICATKYSADTHFNGDTFFCVGVPKHGGEWWIEFMMDGQTPSIITA